MLIAALTWPEAAVRITLVATIGFVVAVVVWSIFRTGQVAIKKELREQRELDRRS